jgi:O-antigen/teichoic acid export membrane protein
MRENRIFAHSLLKTSPLCYHLNIILTPLNDILKLMNRLRRVIGNTVISLLGQGVTWTSTLLLTIAYGRFLGDIRFGELYFAITFVALIGFPIEFGFNQQLTRDVAQEPALALRYLSNILCIKIVLWSVFYGCILLACWLLGYPMETRTLVEICGVTLLSGSIANTFSALHYSFERVIFPVVGTILEKGLTALVGIIVLKYGGSVQTMAYILLGGSFISACWQAICAFRLLGIPRNIDFALIGRLLRTSIPFLVYGVLGVIYYRIDTVLLSLMENTAVVGWYGAGYRIFDTLIFLPSLVISAIMYPVFAKLSVHSESSLKIAVEKSMNFLLFFGIPIAIGCIVAAPNIIGFLYHRTEFINAVPVLQALAPGLLFLYINSVLSSTMLSTKQEKKITIMAAIALIFNLGLNLILIPLYRHVGAAIVTSLTELLLTCLALIFTRRSLRPVRSLAVAAKAIIAGLGMAALIWFMRPLSIFVILPAAMLIYFTTAMLLGTIPRDDLKALYTSIRHKTRHAPSEMVPDEERSDRMPIAEIVPDSAAEERTSARTGPLAKTSSPLVDLRHEMQTLNALPPIEDNEDTLPMKAMRRLTIPETPQVSFSMLEHEQAHTDAPQSALAAKEIFEDDEETLRLKTIRKPTIPETPQYVSFPILQKEQVEIDRGR